MVVNNKSSQFYTGLFLSTAIVSSAHGAQQTKVQESKNSGQSLNSHHAKYLKSSNKNGFNPPRNISPEQFRQSLKNNKAINEFYQSKLSPRTETKKNILSRSIATSCTSPAELQSLSGADLVNAVKSSVLNSCLYGLFDKNLVGTNVFSDASITTIASAIDAHLASYDGSEANSAAELEKLEIYLRALHWAEWGNTLPTTYFQRKLD